MAKILVKSNIIFLDIDGVLNTVRTRSHPPLEPACMNVLNKIISLTHSKVVISSNWRTILTIGELTKLLGENNFVGEIIGYTEVYMSAKFSDYSCKRAKEILNWLRRYKKKVDRYLILDDNDLGKGEELLINNFIKTDRYVGLEDNHIDIATKILGV